MLSNVRETGIKIGAGAYGSVEEVDVLGAICAAKKIHDIFQDPQQVPSAVIRQATAQFVRECQLMSVFSARLAVASARYGATADEPS